MALLLALCLIINFYQVLTITTKNENVPELENLSDSVMTCEKGWYGYNDKCYRFGGSDRLSKVLNLNWEKALEFCRNEGGSLATIDNQDVQNFVVTFFILGNVTEVANGVWIGLHDRVTEGKYEWSDATEVNFTNWSPHEPSGDRYGDEDCANIQFHPNRNIGTWNDFPCGREMPFLCQKNQVRMPISIAPLDAKFCSDENNSGWKFRHSCFNLVPERKTWREAEKYCQKQYSGHLIAVKDILVDFYLDYMLKNLEGALWIGVEIEKLMTQKWTSGWLVGYSGWKNIKTMMEGTCAIRYASENWSSDTCTRKYPFVCESSNESPPILPVTVPGATCPEEPEDWRDLGGDKCYFFETGVEVNWFEASFLCLQRGGTLASLHSPEELDVLRSFVQFTKNELHIGLYQQVKGGREFIWSDQTPFDFQQNWDAGEPNRDIESCSVIYTSNMKFHNYMCDERRGYICATKKVLPIITPNKTALIITDKKCPRVISFSALAGILVAILCAVVVIGVVTLCCVKFRTNGRKSYSRSRVASIADLPGSRKSRACSEMNNGENDEMYYEIMS
ncbi:macrophage mannose receptor 1-like [Uloborus diversus]|uniref:macrophage mannose receptor 1-like n=1 Tax=Uloborus diversus TaxID=327109 RepID=UPI002409F306|nr:macrophage mannose receptor 1-like [Uloborus diversus]